LGCQGEEQEGGGGHFLVERQAKQPDTSPPKQAEKPAFKQPEPTTPPVPPTQPTQPPPPARPAIPGAGAAAPAGPGAGLGNPFGSSQAPTSTQSSGGTPPGGSAGATGAEATGRRVGDIGDFLQGRSHAALNPDGRFLVTVGSDRAVRVWNTHTG